MDEVWYRLTDVSEMLGVHKQTVRKWIKTGQLQATLFGGGMGYRISAGELEKFVERRTAAGQAVREMLAERGRQHLGGRQRSEGTR